MHFHKKINVEIVSLQNPIIVLNDNKDIMHLVYSHDCNAPVIFFLSWFLFVLNNLLINNEQKFNLILFF